MLRATELYSILFQLVRENSEDIKVTETARELGMLRFVIAHLPCILLFYDHHQAGKIKSVETQLLI